MYVGDNVYSNEMARDVSMRWHCGYQLGGEGCINEVAECVVMRCRVLAMRYQVTMYVCNSICSISNETAREVSKSWLGCSNEVAALQQ